MHLVVGDQPAVRTRGRKEGLAVASSSVYAARVLCVRLGLLLSLVLVGCGWVVDADRFRRAAQDDAGEGVDAGPVFDGPPRLQPDELWEGAGGPPDLGRGVPLLFTGIVGTEVEALDPGLTLTEVTVDPSGTALAVRAFVDVDPALAEGERRTVRLEVGSDTFELSIRGLDELSLSGDVQTPLAERYSEIRTSAPVRLVGTDAVRLVTEGLLLIEHPIDASARGQDPGPGGFSGGEASQAGGGMSGGRPGADVTGGCAGGGGGGGGRDEGGAGGRGAPGGQPGLPPLSMLTGASQGGGGGGAARMNQGGIGGGGGGRVWLEGAVVQQRAAIEARGGDGAGGDGQGCGQDGSGGGGGGSGGIVVLRARARQLGEGRIDVSGGLGAGRDQRQGGAGAAGWVRVDGLTPRTADIRGPAWAFGAPVVRTGAELEFSGPPAETLELTLDGTPRGVLDLDSEGRGRFVLGALGLHQLCLRLRCPDCTLSGLATSCVTVVALSP